MPVVVCSAANAALLGKGANMSLGMDASVVKESDMCMCTDTEQRVEERVRLGWKWHRDGSGDGHRDGRGEERMERRRKGRKGERKEGRKGRRVHQRATG